MACDGCKERTELLTRAREAYRRGDMPEVRRLVREVFGTAIVDIDSLISAIVRAKSKRSS